MQTLDAVAGTTVRLGRRLLAWVLAQRQVTAAIIGVRNTDQPLDGNLSATGLKLTDDQLPN